MLDAIGVGGGVGGIGEIRLDERHADRAVEQGADGGQVQVNAFAVHEIDAGFEDAGDAVALGVALSGEENGVADREAHAAGDAHADDDGVGILGEGGEGAVDDLALEVGDVDEGGEVDAVGLRVVFAEVGQQGRATANHGRGGGDAGETGERLEHDVGVLDAGDVFDGAVHADGEGAVAAGGEGGGALHAILDPHHAVHAEDGLDEVGFEAGGLGLGDDEKRDAENDARETHQHRALASAKEAEGDE